MATQRIISSILLCAFTVLFAHSITPHLHHEAANATHQISQHDNDHDDADNNFLSRVFSNFQHASSGSIYHSTSPTFKYSKFNIDKQVVLITEYFIRQLFKPPIKHFEHNFFTFIPSNYTASNLFRGPPIV